MLDYQPSLSAPPMWAHQRRCLDESVLRENYGIFFEARCGKSRAAIDSAACWFDYGWADAMLIISWPSGVHRNWATVEVPAYLPERIKREIVLWRTGHVNETFKRAFRDAIKTLGMAVLSVNAEAISTKKCQEYLSMFLAYRKVFLIIDEADYGKELKSLRHKTTVAISQHPNVRGRRVLTATPATEHPLEFYAIMLMLSPKILGFSSFYAFRARYALLEDRSVYVPGGRLQRFKAIAQDANGRPVYKNMDEFRAKIAAHSMRVLRSEVSDAPPKIYQKRFYEPSEEQMRVYRDLRDRYRAELADGSVRTAAHVFQRMSLLQHVLGNRMPTYEKAYLCTGCEGDGCATCDHVGMTLENVEATVIDPTDDPRLDALRVELEANPGVPTIVWARYTHEVDAILTMAAAIGRRPVRFDGLVDEADRAVNLTAFRSNEADVLIGNQAAGGRGLDMSTAGLMIFYSNTFSLRTRLQAEDRGESIRKKVSTGIVDICAVDTIDEMIIDALRGKQDLFDSIMSGSKVL